MESDKVQTLPPPPGVVGSLKSGFDIIASNLPAILLPMGLDLFLWLGPRLHIDQLFKPVFDEIPKYASSSGLSASDALAVQATYNSILVRLEQYNLLSVIRTFPVGVFSLMSGKMPLNTPFGSPSILHVGSLQTLILWVGLLTLIGWLAGSLFFRWVASVVGDSTQPVKVDFSSSILQTILLSIVWIALLFTFGIPALSVLALILASNPLMAQGILLIIGLLSMWLIVPVFFTPHGIFMQRQNAFVSIYTSFQMARFTLPTSSLFVISVLLITFGLNYLWNIPASDSWMTLVGIAGHAFITTSLLAASYIYYRDMHTWLQTVLKKFKANLPAEQV
jgi:hypothetical protein